MGNETSTNTREEAPASPEAAESLPFQYASYSKEKEPTQPSKAAKGAAPGKDPTNNFITVNAVKRARKNEKMLDALDAIPKFLPIIRGSLGVGSAGAQENATIDHRQLVCICNRYQDHLQKSAKVVDDRQATINGRMRWVAKNAGARATRFGKIAQKMQKGADKVVDVRKVQEKITKMDDVIKHVLLPRMQELNGMLPPDLRLEPFRYSFDSTQFSPLEMEPEEGDGGTPAQLPATTTLREMGLTNPASPARPTKSTDPVSAKLDELEAGSEAAATDLHDLRWRLKGIQDRAESLPGKGSRKR